MSDASKDVSSIPDEELLRRAVRSARANYRKGQKHRRWIAVSHVFGLGNTDAWKLCERFGIDPDEMVKR